jgi:hypothetical protein
VYRPEPKLERADTEPSDWTPVEGYHTAMVRFSDKSWQLVHLTARRRDAQGRWWYFFWWGDSGTVHDGWYRYDPEHIRAQEPEAT